MKKTLFLPLFSLFSLLVNAQLRTPKISTQEVLVTRLDVSWTRDANATGYVLQRATDAAFTQNLTTVYTGPAPVWRETGLTQNTTYYYRVKSTNGASESAWATTSVKTLWSPSAASQGGNRFATAADVGPGGIWENTTINEGDYVIVGNTGGGFGGEFGVACAFGVPAIGSGAGQLNIAAGKKIVFLGGRGYDYIVINSEGGSGEGNSTDSLIITNAMGQVVAHSIELWSPQWTKLTGMYDAVNRRGDPNYKGFQSENKDRLSGTFGFYFKGQYANTGRFGIYVKGDAHHVTIEYVESGGGGYTGLSAKNDGSELHTFSLPNTGGAWQTVTQGSITIPYPTSTIRLLANWGSSNYKVNWVEFVGASTYRIEAENYHHKVGLSTEATTDPDGGGSNITNFNAGSTRDFADYNTVIPAGTYTINARVSTTTTGCGLTIRQASANFDNFEVRYVYFRDHRQGENAYWGSTQEAPQQKFTNLHIHHCVFSRAGLNAIQTGQLLGDGNIVEHNVGMSSGTAWSNTFQRFQDQTIQQSSYQHGFKYRNNIWTGGGESFINLFLFRFGGYSSSEMSIDFKNNLFDGLQGETGGYINTKDPAGATINIDSNVFRRCIAGGGRYPVLYPWQATPVNYVITFESNHDPTIAESAGVATMNARWNKYDLSWSAGNFVVKAGTTANLTVNESGNERAGDIPAPKFSNYMDLPEDYDYSKIEAWVWGLSPQWNRYNTAGTEAANGPSTSSLTIPQSHPTAITMTIATIGNSGDVFTILEPGKNFSVGEYVVVKKNVYEESNHFVMQVTSWNATTGVLQGNSVSHHGSGTYNTWTVSRVRTYNEDDIVYYNSRFYRSLTDNNRANQPSLDGDSNWEVIVFSNGSLIPADDLRLEEGSYYAERGMGLQMTYSSQAEPSPWKGKVLPPGTILKRKKF